MHFLGFSKLIMLKNLAPLFILMTIINFSGALCATESERIPVDFEFTVSKSTVQLGDFISLRYKITNPLNKSMVLNLNSAYNASFVKIIDRAGRIMTWERKVLYERPWEKIKTYVLAPYESITFSVQPTLQVTERDEFVLDFVDSQVVLKRPGAYQVYGYIEGFDLDKINQKADAPQANDKKVFKPVVFLNDAYSNNFTVNFLR